MRIPDELFLLAVSVPAAVAGAGLTAIEVSGNWRWGGLVIVGLVGVWAVTLGLSSDGENHGADPYVEV